jgi:hypothetical protein
MDRDAFRREAEVAFGRVRDAMTAQVLTFEPGTRAAAPPSVYRRGIAGAPVVQAGAYSVVSSGTARARDTWLRRRAARSSAASGTWRTSPWPT